MDSPAQAPFDITSTTYSNIICINPGPTSPINIVSATVQQYKHTRAPQPDGSTAVLYNSLIGNKYSDRYLSHL